MSGRSSLPSPFRALDPPVVSQGDDAANACVCFRSGGEVTRAAAAAAVAALTRELGDTPSGRWLVYNVDGLGAAVSLLALARSGGCAVMASNAQTETLQRLAEGVHGALLEPGVTLVRPGLRTLRPLDVQESPPGSARTIDPHALIAELQTSGTSGEGKAVSKEVRHLADEVALLEACFGERLGRDVSIFGTVSPQHIYGLLFRVLWPLASGRPFQADTLLLPQELLPRMAERPASALVTTPSHLARMAQRDELAALRGGCRAIFSSGAALPAATRDAVERSLGGPPIEILGSTETGGIAWRQGEGDWTAFPGAEIACGDDGRLVVTSPVVSSGTPAGPGRRRFVTGDLCELRGPGRFALAGRADRVVKIAGKRLSLPVMEQELVAHACVAEAALVPIERAHEPRVHALVAVSEQGREVLARQGFAALRTRLQGHLAARFDPVLLPRAWRCVAVLPRDAQGKVTAASVRAHFVRVTEPELLGETRAANTLVQRLRVPHDLVYLEGHFPERPVVPGVVALSWVMAAASAWLGTESSPRCIDVVKFPTPLLPGQAFDLRIEHVPASQRIRFELREDSRVFASGRVTLGAEVDA